MSESNYRRWMVAIGIATVVLAALRLWISR